jgi:hypothetical protein
MTEESIKGQWALPPGLLLKDIIDNGISILSAWIERYFVLISLI